MPKRNVAHLDATLLARKGEAAPASASVQTREQSTNSTIPKGTKDTIAVTVRLDAERYQRLVQYGAQFVPRRTNQEILIVALDAYLAQVGE
jgi:hypothetical protein